MDRNRFVQLFSFYNGIFSGAILSFRESISWWEYCRTEIKPFCRVDTCAPLPPTDVDETEEMFGAPCDLYFPNDFTSNSSHSTLPHHMIILHINHEYRGPSILPNLNNALLKVKSLKHYPQICSFCLLILSKKWEMTQGRFSRSQSDYTPKQLTQIYI